MLQFVAKRNIKILVKGITKVPFLYQFDSIRGGENCDLMLKRSV